MTGPNARSQSVLLIIFSAHRGVSVSSQEMSSFTSHSGPGVGVGGTGVGGTGVGGGGGFFGGPSKSYLSRLSQSSRLFLDASTSAVA